MLEAVQGMTLAVGETGLGEGGAGLIVTLADLASVEA